MRSMNKQFSHELSEFGLVPDMLIRHGIRRLLKQRLGEVQADNCEFAESRQQEFIERMNNSPIAILPHKANEQHYEVPVNFFRKTLGHHLKYSCSFWPQGVDSLDEAEDRALMETCSRAGIENGMSILELGCGWGALSFWIARHYPDCEITAVSNSRTQGEFIRQYAQYSQLDNINVITADMNDFQPQRQFDRVLSLEMFEHMRNWDRLFRRINTILTSRGKFFMHIFVHRSTPYLFEDRQANDWMSRFFFSGGMMPSADLPLFFQSDLRLQNRWFWNGNHYTRTCNAWLDNMDENRDLLWSLFKQIYGRDFARLWWMRWRIFFMACAELFAYRNGEEWFVAHYLFTKQANKWYQG